MGRGEENVLVLVEIWALARDEFTTRELAEFLGVCPRAARRYVRLLRERGLVAKVGPGRYRLEDLDAKALRLLIDLLDRIHGAARGSGSVAATTAVSPNSGAQSC